MVQGPIGLSVETYQGGKSALNLTGTSLVKATGGRVMQINVNAASTSAMRLARSSTWISRLLTGSSW
jgi:hypothetical protein